ncbi:MAG: tRNA pseudouridine(55) synthase TruB [Actinobacteria bacterium]|nr:tRNA pseudouridine(55) synthase TruB [Actinomycetota bacterium]
MNGLISVLKPPGMSSHDVVNRLRSFTGTKKVGHTGTLDPGAAGVLLVCCGRATRLIEYLDHNKKYRAEITFGMTSSTGDSFGELTPGDMPGDFSMERLLDTIRGFTGEISQVPPMTSAVRHQGKKLYELARAGKVVERRARPVKIYSLEMARWYQDPRRPRALLDISCSAGTYIRTLCQDIGEKMGCGAYMSFLLRTGVGDYAIADAHTLEELNHLTREGRLQEAVISVERALAFLPEVRINEGTLKPVCSGATLYPPGIKDSPGGIGEGALAALEWEGRYVAVARAAYDDRGRLCFKPEKIIV